MHNVASFTKYDDFVNPRRSSSFMREFDKSIISKPLVNLLYASGLAIIWAKGCSFKSSKLNSKNSLPLRILFKSSNFS